MWVRTLLIAIAIGLATMLLAGCSGLGRSLEGRAADYYNHLAGHSPGKKLSTFISPVRKRDFDKDNLATLNDMGSGEASDGNQEADASHVKTVELDGFAYTIIDPSLGAPFRYMKPKRWVRDGRQWYIFEGSSSEVAAYGEFPTALAAPDWAELIAAEVEAAAASVTEGETTPSPDS